VFASRPQRIVLARYSTLKVGAWISVALFGSGEALWEGWLNGWKAPPGAVRPDLYLLGYGAAPLIAVIALALLLRFVMSGGVAIERDSSDLVLNYPFGRKRISLGKDVTAFAETKAVDVPRYGVMFKPPTLFADQVTFARTGLPNIQFRTGLLTETADVVARRIAGAI
jgi:hypothetical protein